MVAHTVRCGQISSTCNFGSATRGGPPPNRPLTGANQVKIPRESGKGSACKGLWKKKKKDREIVYLDVGHIIVGVKMIFVVGLVKPFENCVPIAPKCHFSFEVYLSVGRVNPLS
jgi:hypothetical protein